VVVGWRVFLGLEDVCGGEGERGGVVWRGCRRHCCLASFPPLVHYLLALHRHEFAEVTHGGDGDDGRDREDDV